MDLDEFYRDASELPHKRVLIINNALVDFNLLPNFIGSHIIRDPRDLLVSWYRHHLWCNEDWAIKPMNVNLAKRLGLAELRLESRAEGNSYQQLLNSLDELTGYKVELNWRRYHFRNMQLWDYRDPRVLEIKYEEVFDNEQNAFQKLFLHYGIPERDIRDLLRIVDQHSFRSLADQKRTGIKKHATFGHARQWKSLLPEEIKDIFRHEYGKLLIELGYESSFEW